MNVEVFAIYDNKAKSFMQPFFAMSTPLAVRMMMVTCSDPETMMYKFPEDFALFQIGRFNDQSGELETLKHVNLGLAVNFKRELGNGKDAPK